MAKSSSGKAEGNGDGPVQCFVIMPISTQNGYDDGHFDLVYEDIIKPSIKSANMETCRADETKNTNLIQLDILRKVIESPIAICDMSAKNPNVFYELGMRQAFDMPTVLLKDDATDAPFDINGLRYVTYSKSMKHREVLSAVKELTETLIDTYEKREDTTEINSLIRLMELANPAALSTVELSDELRLEKINELSFKEIQATLNVLVESQRSIIEQIEREKSSVRHTNARLGLSGLSGLGGLASLIEASAKAQKDVPAGANEDASQ